MEKEIIEGNKLIAEFMGHKMHLDSERERVFYLESYPTLPHHREGFDIPLGIYSHGKYTESNWIDAMTKNKKVLTERISIANLKYHSSWNWLMPVVEKISKLETPNDKYENGERIYVENYSPRTFGLMNENGEYLFRFNGHQLLTSESFIGSVYLGVVDFIKWYNENKK